MNAQTEQSSSVGVKFRQTRIGLNLSLEDVSKETALRPSILQYIENDKFVHKNIPAIFMRGYVRNYATFLGLPRDVWEHIDFGENLKNDLGKNSRSTRAVNRYFSHHRWIGVLTVLVLVVVIGMTGLWWWQNYQQLSAERDTLVQNYMDNNANNDLTSSNNTFELPISSTESADNQNELTVIDNQSIAEETITETNSTVTEMPVTPSLSEQNNTMLAASQQQTTETTTQADLVIEITDATSWISIKDKNNKTLAQKEYKQGEVLRFNGDEYSIVIGAPSNVRMSYKGESYPLNLDGRIAKIKLPKS